MTLQIQYGLGMLKEGSQPTGQGAEVVRISDLSTKTLDDPRQTMWTGYTSTRSERLCAWELGAWSLRRVDGHFPPPTLQSSTQSRSDQETKFEKTGAGIMFLEGIDHRCMTGP